MNQHNRVLIKLQGSQGAKGDDQEMRTYGGRILDDDVNQWNDEQEAAARALVAGQCEKTVAAGRCTLCENDAAELVPWATGERLCWECVDQQMDLLARAVEDILPVEVKHLDVAVTRELVHA
jgi:hypothetical protein